MPDGFAREPAPVTLLAPSEMASFEMMTPSITNSGCPLPRIDVTPRICICAPPPGAPLFIEIVAPGTLPCIACSSDCAGALVSSSFVNSSGSGSNGQVQGGAPERTPGQIDQH